MGCVLVWGQSQLGTGALTGIVEDASGKVIPAVTLNLVNTGTGVVRRAESNGSGVFAFKVLQPGAYTLKAEKQGFQTVEQTGITVTVGGTATLNLRLAVGAVNQVVTVEAQALIDTVKVDESSVVNREQINDLPINGRRFDQFALLTPGVTRDGRFGLLSYRGQSGVFNNFMIEGNDDNQAYFSEARGRTRIASNISANAIQEFRVGQSNFLAELGRAAGGAINATVRSGGNQFHADGFWYFRNQLLNARDPLASFKPTERRDQFGGSVSGALIKDRLFYFLNYDQQLRDFPLVTEDLSQVLTIGRPVLPANPTPAQQQQFDRDLLAFNAGVADLRLRFPNGAPGNALPRNANQWLGLAKVDYQLSDKNNLSIFYNHLHANGQNAIQTPLVLGNVGRNGTDDVRINSFNARLTTSVSAAMLNEFRFQWGRNWEFQFGNERPPQVFVGGFSYGLATFLERPALPDERRLQFVDNYSIITGKHQLKFGGEINRAYDIIDNPANFGGSYSYTNALLYGRDLLRQTTTQNYTNFQQAFGLPGITFSTIDYAGFAQDQWKITRYLTLTYGLRYDFQRMPDVKNPNPAQPLTARIPNDFSNWGPRAGVAWDISKKGNTVIRGGWGLYYGRTPNGIIGDSLRNTGLTEPDKATFTITWLPTDPGAPTFPNTISGLPSRTGTPPTATLLGDDFRRPRVQELNIGVEQKIWFGFVASGSFLYNRGDRLPVTFDTNLPSPQFQRIFILSDTGRTFTVPFSAGVTRTAGGVTQNVNASRRNPALGAINVQRSLGQNWYRAGFFELRRRMSSNAMLNMAYTLAKVENLVGAANGGGAGAESVFSGGTFADQFNLSGNRGIAPTDQRHRLVVNGVYNVAKLRGGLRFLNGFRTSGIYTAESGRPYSAGLNIPNLPFTVDGVQYNGFGGLRGQGGGGDRNILPTVARNSDYGEWNYRVDFRVARDFPVGERFRVEILGEAFNLFNISNFNGFQTTFYDAVATTATTPLSQNVVLNRNSGFGRENNNSSQPDGTNARRFQLALRFRF
jgi:hypothetical protein